MCPMCPVTEKSGTSQKLRKHKSQKSQWFELLSTIPNRGCHCVVFKWASAGKRVWGSISERGERSQYRVAWVRFRWVMRNHHQAANSVISLHLQNSSTSSFLFLGVHKRPKNPNSHFFSVTVRSFQKEANAKRSVRLCCNWLRRGILTGTKGGWWGEGRKGLRNCDNKSVNIINN